MNTCCLTFVGLNGSDFELEESVPGIPTAGDNFTMTCMFIGPDRLAITPQLSWEVQIGGNSPIDVTSAEADIGTVTIGDTVTTGSATFSTTLSFTSIRTSQARRYLCNVFISGIIDSSVFADLDVQSMSHATIVI